MPHLPRLRLRLRLRLLTAAAALCALATTTAIPARAAAPTPPRGGVVPGLTGAAARRLAGPAAAAFRAKRAADLAAARRSAPPTVPASSPRAAATIHNAWGIFPPDSSGYKIRADQSVVIGLTLSGQEYLYAPTTKAPSGSCAELTTAYTPSGAYLWAWDWCVADDVAKIVPLDGSFQSTYTTTVHGHLAYTMDEVRTDAASNTWTIYLFNYATHVWDVFYRQSGRDITGVPYGWDTFEVYTTPAATGADGPYCGEIAGHTFESSGIYLYTASGGWSIATPGNAPGLQPLPSGGDFGCSALRFSVPAANSDWVVRR